MSAYPLSPHRRQPSTTTPTVSSLASAYTANFAQGTNTIEPPSVSSRASWMPEKRNSVSNVRQALAALETSTPNAASTDSTALSRPPPITTNSNRHSFHDTRFLREEREKREQKEQNALLGSPLSPSTDRLVSRRPGLGHTHTSSLGGNELVLRDRKEQDALESPLSPPPARSAGRPRLGHTQTASLSGNELSSLKHSSVSHFRTLSQISTKGASEFAVPESDDVAGMHGRKRLQRAPTDQMSSWERMNWMDKRRKYIQAYEYLCHIGEAKEWIEECITEEIPAIVELEEALRNGVTLAKVVRVFAPELVPRIFDAPKLQFRHSDNITRFFRFLKQVELPEVFHFELTDLYNKKNIPKVIYCIHALAFLLFRLGMTEKAIGNLVGKLEFTEDEIQNTQRGLDIAGVTLPSFRGMDKHFGDQPAEPEEPEESEEDRIERELHENEYYIEELQRIARGALVRLGLARKMQVLWDEEPAITELQAAIRGMFARTSYAYRSDMYNWSRDVQAHTRGFLARRRFAKKSRPFAGKEEVLVKLQSKIRANAVREKLQKTKNDAQRQTKSISRLQGVIRGALLRKSFGEQQKDVTKHADSLTKVQAAIRGRLVRDRVDEKKKKLASAEPTIVKIQARARGLALRSKLQVVQEDLAASQDDVKYPKLQAAARGKLARRRFTDLKEALAASDDDKLHQLQGTSRGVLQRRAFNDIVKRLHDNENLWTRLQAQVRGNMVRNEYHDTLEALEEFTPEAVRLQAGCRAVLVRKHVKQMNSRLEAALDIIVDLQARARGTYRRKKINEVLSALKQQEQVVIEVQSTARGYLFRKQHFGFLEELEKTADSVSRLNAWIRAATVRGQVADIIASLEEEEEQIIELQAYARGFMQRKKFQEKLKFFKDNMEKVVKIQSFVRAKQQGEAYRSLVSGKNPPVGTIKNFVHLLNDSDFDFDEEIEFERLRKNVIQHVRANEMAEQYIDQLDIKIALLVKNKITLDEVIKHQKRFTGHVGNLLSNVDLSSSDPFDLKALNKNSRRKLELYQTLFFALQTQPVYLARFFRRVREQATPDKEIKRIETLIMGLFGYAQKRREEYYLLKLISRSIKEEVDMCEGMQDYLKGNFFWGRLMMNYVRSPRDRKFMRDFLGPLVRENIIENDELDLESDPMQIYRSSVNQEELRTGRRSSRKQNIAREEAIRDPETRETFIQHLQDLRDLADTFLAALEDNLHRLPFGVRYLAQQSVQALIVRFPNESYEAILQIVGHFIYQRYINPVILSPDSYGAAEKVLTPMHKKNLGELSKMISQISAGKLFTHENVYLQPLNEYVSTAIRRMKDIFADVISIQSAEDHFGIDEFDDLTSTQKPILYIKMADIFAIHQMITQEAEFIAPSREDQLRDIVRELGSVKTNEEALQTFSGAEITLQLNPRFQKVDDTESEIKALLVETKRCILYIIRIQTGSNLMEILVKPICHEDEERWMQLVREEQSGKRKGAYSEMHALSDVSSMTYAELKRTALENIINLEKTGRITRKNQYQDLLNAIATDIRTKHKRRIERGRELDNVKQTLAHLNEKATYLEGQLQSYNDYIEQAMVTLQSKKGKKRSIMPFTRQYFHMKELKKSGKVPKFGSYKYSAKALAEKGVLVTLQGYAENQWDKVNFTLSSDEVGVFFLEASHGTIQIPGASAHVPLDDLLQAQFNNHQFMNLFEGMIKLNVNLFLHLLFRKFYRDE